MVEATRPTRVTLSVLLACGLCAALASPADAKVKVVTTLTDYAWAAKAIGGDLVEVEALCPANQDAHFLSPRPSYIVKVSQADLFVDTGMDLELWASALLQKAGNDKVMPGSKGYVSASEGVPKLEVPASADRSQGDVHIFGNPHLHTSPINMRTVVDNIARGLRRVDPDHDEAYARKAAEVTADLDVRLFGRDLVALIGGPTLAKLAQKGKLSAFLEGRKYKGEALDKKLGGWFGVLAHHRGQAIVTYHKNWVYLTALFGLEVPITVEVKPGIPPSAGHVESVLRVIADRKIPVLLAVSYFPKKKVESVAKRAGTRPVVVPFHTGADGTHNYPELVDRWVSALDSALEQGASR